MNIIWIRTKMTPKQPSYTKSELKVIPKCSQSVQSCKTVTPMPPQSGPAHCRGAGSGVLVAPRTSNILSVRMSIFCLWTCLRRTQGDMICITYVIRRLFAIFGVYFSLSSLCLPYLWKFGPKVVSIWPYTYMKSWNSVRNKIIFWERTIMTPKQPSYT